MSGRPPVPSIAPPTDDIDAEWGTDEIPAAPKVPQLSAAPSVPAPAARSSSSPPRPTSAAPLATASAAPANNPLRKQTLFGIAPVIPPRSDAPPAASAASPPPVADPSAARAENPLRKQTLFGIAPVVPARAPEPVAPVVESPVRGEAGASDAPAPGEVPASDAPLARDVAAPARAAKPRAASSDDLDDVPALRAKGSRWFLPVAAAAVLALGFVGLQRLDRAPAPTQAPVAAIPVAPAAQAEQAVAVAPADPAPAAPEPAAVEPAPVAAEPAPAAPIEAQTAAPAPGAATGAAVSRVNVTSDPPGARMFWKGHEVGTTPFVLEIPAGERRSFELGRPGFVTRKVVIDGSKPDISIGLRPDSAAAIGASGRK